MTNHIARLLTLLLLLNFTASPAATLQLEIIPLQGRSAEEVIPIIKPLVVEGGTVTGMNNQLIIKTTAANLAEIKQLLKQIDKPARRLMITVRQDTGGAINQDEQSLSGRYRSGDASVSIGDGRPANSGLAVGAEDDQGNRIQYRTQSTRSNIDDNNNFRIMTLEGRPAFIQSGQSVPVPSSTTVAGPGGVVVQESIEYRDVTSGFYVLPRLSGDNVTLLISPNMASTDQRQGGGFNIQNVQTTVSGKLGQWLRVGGINQETQSNQRGTLYSTRRQRQSTSAILLKVDEIP